MREHMCGSSLCAPMNAQGPGQQVQLPRCTNGCTYQGVQLEVGVQGTCIAAGMRHGQNCVLLQCSQGMELLRQGLLCISQLTIQEMVNG